MGQARLYARGRRGLASLAAAFEGAHRAAVPQMDALVATGELTTLKNMCAATLERIAMVGSA